MINKILPSETSLLIESIKKSKAIIFPFTESPASTRGVLQQEGKGGGPISATNLFSLFTANIIKEEVVFTR